MGVFDFKFTANPQLYFGPGKVTLLPLLIRRFGKNLLLMTGSHSFQRKNHYKQLLDALKKDSVRVYTACVDSEPSPFQVDEMVQLFHLKNIQVVAAIGGGSVIDAGKAVSAMLTRNDPVSTFLEGVGTQTHDGRKIPFIAVPTTAGTGSEATRNAVLSHVGQNGFKKSLRHENFVPDIALIDPELTLSCPGEITAACGMDALTQLIESYVSVNASPMTDSLAIGALGVMGDSILSAAIQDPADLDARTRLCYGSYISGLTLANAGLGVVHGFAAAIGAGFPIPHGVVCGALLAQATQKNIEHLIRLGPGVNSLIKYARIGKILARTQKNEIIHNAERLSTLLMEWTTTLKIPRLSRFGVKRDDVETIVSDTTQKNNPAVLTKQELNHILESCL